MTLKTEAHFYTRASSLLCVNVCQHSSEPPSRLLPELAVTNLASTHTCSVFDPQATAVQQVTSCIFHNYTCAFASQFSPLLHNRVLRSMKLLYSRRELLQSTCHAWQFGHVQSRSQTPPTGRRLHSRMTCRITGLRKPSEISEKGLDLFSNYFLHASTHATCVHIHKLQYRKPAQVARGGEGV